MLTSVHGIFVDTQTEWVYSITCVIVWNWLAYTKHYDDGVELTLRWCRRIFTVVFLRNSCTCIFSDQNQYYCRPRTGGVNVWLCVCAVVWNGAQRWHAKYAPQQQRILRKCNSTNNPLENIVYNQTHNRMNIKRISNALASKTGKRPNKASVQAQPHCVCVCVQKWRMQFYAKIYYQNISHARELR